MIRWAKRTLRRFIYRCLYGVISDVASLSLESDRSIKSLATAGLAQRFALKRLDNAPIRVVLIAHDPTLWSSFDSLYAILREDPSFDVRVLVLPRMVSGFVSEDAQASYQKMLDFCEGGGIRHFSGLSETGNLSMTPADYIPDYVFHQVPYEFYGSDWSVENLSKVSRICYVPYGTTIFGGSTFKTVHPPNYFRHANLIFAESETAAKLIASCFDGNDWFCPNKIIVSGNLKLESVKRSQAIIEFENDAGDGPKPRQVLWTPRWNTKEKVCHFFDYRQFLMDYFVLRSNERFVFRPHPLAFENFVKTGEMTAHEVVQLKQVFDQAEHLALDETMDYANQFAQSDILISDTSSMMVEFLISGKPIIYTHREDLFNELGHEIAAGMYWARNEKELRMHLDALLGGEDPLRSVRAEILASGVLGQIVGPAQEVKVALAQDVVHCIQYALN